jgi:hypothetical protein
MSVTPEQLAAFADDQLDGEEARAVAASVAVDPVLQAQVDAHRALRARLAAHFAPVAAAEVPERLRAAVLSGRPEGNVVDFAAAKRRASPPRPLRYALPALAASLVAAFLGLSAWHSRYYAQGELAEALDNQLAAAAPANAPVRVLLSFRDNGGQFCRAYAGRAKAGIACRDRTGWRLRFDRTAGPDQRGEFSQAGNADAAVMAAAQEMAAGPALDAGQEAAAARSQWQAE